MSYLATFLSQTRPPWAARWRHVILIGALVIAGLIAASTIGTHLRAGATGLQLRADAPDLHFHM